MRTFTLALLVWFCSTAFGQVTDVPVIGARATAGSDDAAQVLSNCVQYIGQVLQGSPYTDALLVNANRDCTRVTGIGGEDSILRPMGLPVPNYSRLSAYHADWLAMLEPDHSKQLVGVDQVSAERFSSRRPQPTRAVITDSTIPAGSLLNSQALALSERQKRRITNSLELLLSDPKIASTIKSDRPLKKDPTPP